MPDLKPGYNLIRTHATRRAFAPSGAEAFAMDRRAVGKAACGTRKGLGANARPTSARRNP